jgi:hypothetical protein
MPPQQEPLWRAGTRHDNWLRSLLLNSTPQSAERKRRRDTELAKLPQTVASAYAKFGKAEEATSAATAWSFHDNATPEATPWLIKNILPHTGAGLISGQWGSYKTTVALDIAVSVMTAMPFAGRFGIKRSGGVAYFAPEGGGGLGSRLTAARALAAFATRCRSPIDPTVRRFPPPAPPRS